MEEKSRDKYQKSEKDQYPISDGLGISGIEKPTFSKEQEILELEKKIAEKKAGLEEGKEEMGKKERESVKKEKEKIEGALEEEAVSTSVPSASPSAQVQEQVKQLKNLDRRNQVKVLCDLAFQKGLDFALEAAKSLDNAYVLDEFHDVLVDKLYKKLVEGRKLKQL